MKLIFNKKQGNNIKKEILNDFINSELTKLAIKYMNLKMNDSNREKNNIITKKLDLLLDLTNQEINLEKNETNKINFLLANKDEFLQIQAIFKTNKYYEKIFNEFLFYITFLNDKNLQNEVFWEIYKEIEKDYNNFIANKLSNKIDNKIKKVSTTKASKIKKELKKNNHLHP